MGMFQHTGCASIDLGPVLEAIAKIDFTVLRMIEQRDHATEQPEDNNSLNLHQVLSTIKDGVFNRMNEIQAIALDKPDISSIYSQMQTILTKIDCSHNWDDFVCF